MGTTVKHAFSGLLALTLSLLVMPTTADAQERAEEAQSQETCTVQLTPSSVAAGEAAVRVAARLSSAVGEVQSLTTAEESAVGLADPADIQEKADMAQDAPQPEPVLMANEDQTGAILWLNTEYASAGTHQITLAGAEGECTGEVNVTEPGESGDEGGGW